MRIHCYSFYSDVTSWHPNYLHPSNSLLWNPFLPTISSNHTPLSKLLEKNFSTVYLFSIFWCYFFSQCTWYLLSNLTLTPTKTELIKISYIPRDLCPNHVQSYVGLLEEVCILITLQWNDGMSLEFSSNVKTMTPEILNAYNWFYIITFFFQIF